MGFWRLIFLLPAFGGSLAAQLLPGQPLISPKGIVSAASLMVPGLPNGSIARGSMFSIFGASLGPATAVQASSFPIPANLSGVSIKVTQGSVSVDAIPVFANATQVNAIMPSNAPLGLTSVVVSYNNRASFPAPVRIVNSSVGIFAINSGGFGPGVLQNFVAADNQPVNSTVVSAKPLQVVTMWATGLGPVGHADNIAPAAADLPTASEIFVGGKVARKLYAGRAPCCSGVDQVVFEVPQDAPLGCWVPVQARTEGRVVSNTVTMAISANGGACSDAGNALSRSVASGGKLGLAALVRLNGEHSRGKLRLTSIYDFASVSFRQEQGGPFAFNPLLSLPPAGACTVLAGRTEVFGGPNAVYTAPAGYLDGGSSFSLLTPRGGATVAASRTTAAFRAIGINLADFPPLNRNQPLLEPGSYQLNSNGGPNVGAIRASFNLAPPISWTNRDQVRFIDRAQGLTINYSAPPSGHAVLITGSSIDLANNATAMFVCAAPAGSSSFTVPPQTLGALPASHARLNESRGFVMVGAAPLANPPTFTATGLDLGVALPLLLTTKDVDFR